MSKKLIQILFLVLVMNYAACSDGRFDEADGVLKKMDLHSRIGQMIMPGIPGKHISERAKRLIGLYNPGGVILFGENLAGNDEAVAFIEALQQASMNNPGIPMFISIDQEGGRVKRITDGVTQFPGNMAIGVADNEKMTRDMARVLGMQLRAYGVNMNLAPVLDVNNNPLNPVINTRSFGSDHLLVERLGVQYVLGLQDVLCISVVKHFPGHGDTSKDSHLTLPVINHPIERLRKVELPPFVSAIKSGVECVMPAHIAFPGFIKSDMPATVSYRMITEFLKNELKFDGVVITDDMEMNAMSLNMNIGEAAVKAVEAGADIVLFSTYESSIPVIFNAIENAVKNKRISEERINRSVRKILALKLRYGIMKMEKGIIGKGVVVYGRDKRRILGKAEIINESLSRNAIYFNGKIPFSSFADNNYARVAIASNPDFSRELKTHATGSCMIMKGDESLMRFIKNGSRKNIVVFYQVDDWDLHKLKFIQALAKYRGVTPVIIATGNPFLVSMKKDMPPVLYTFSNTLMSMRQAAKCINGDFEPRTSINLSLDGRN
jgi:beta-N-acetylhexosaminidase